MTQTVIASNGYINITNFIYGTTDYAVVEHKQPNRSKRYLKHKIYFTVKGAPFIRVKNVRFYLNEFFKC